eukprot:CAMPEP_0168178746 /NCGR_PEP_ID=MMETSP0139_2-20121125/9368_1 /TAXON_ID=44445 /ORGANISM="Pseudo-nitzschia australis, Strain 10249 10 AB" /LENGTH=599 /DNA_ID=CAMNT_0008098317 /DNA_START=72 /DNA_END=1871 /DNA_ORIENTATION=+
MTTNNNTMPDEECDYLIIGGGACGMAFADTLLGNAPNDSNLRVIVVDKHDSPGGQWHDSYDFVRLHQPSSMYGVESKKLEEVARSDDNSSGSEQQHTNTNTNKNTHRAKRSELLRYYADVLKDLETNPNHNFEFLGNTTLDLAQLSSSSDKEDQSESSNPALREEYTVTNNTTGVARTIRVRKRLVDARNLEPDLPVSTPPGFAFSADKVSVVPVNDLVDDDTTNTLTKGKKHFVVLGGGKTGMDAVFHLLTEKNVSLDDMLWVVPNDAWITARENIGNCIDLLHISAKLFDEGYHAFSTTMNSTSTCSEKESEEKKEGGNDTPNDTAATKTGITDDFFQRGFLEWEKQGHVYRLDPSVVPTKFKDATLSRNELAVLQTAVPRMVRGHRISEITDRGRLVFVGNDNDDVEHGFDLPFPVEDTLFVHCSAGAFHCSKSNKSPPPIFEGRRIVVQDIYGTPGYCFVGSMLGKLESLTGLSDESRNAMAKTPSRPSSSSSSPTALEKLDDAHTRATTPKSGGDVVGAVTRDHPFLQRAHNLKLWLEHPELRRWIFQSRLFHLADRDPASDPLGPGGTHFQNSRKEWDCDGQQLKLFTKTSAY